MSRKLKDVICDNCGYKDEKFVAEDYGVCPECESPLRQDYKSMRMNFTCFANSKWSTSGKLRNFSVKNDAMCSMEIGLLDDHGKYAKLDNSTRLEFRDKYERDGDSVELRKEILKARGDE